MSEVSLVILAAGLGSRFGGPKQAAHVGPNGELLIEYSIFDALAVGFRHIVFVIQKDQKVAFQELLKNKLDGRCEVSFVYQEMADVPSGLDIPSDRSKPWGTGHAVWCCRHVVQGPFAVINADDFYGAHPFAELRRFFASGKSRKAHEYALVGRRVEAMLSSHGFVSRGICHVDCNGHFEKITEEREIGYRDGTLSSMVDGMIRVLNPSTIASMSMWGLDPSVFEFLQRRFGEFLADAAASRKEAEFPISCIAEPREADHVVKLLVSEGHWFGLTHAVDLNDTRAEILKLIKQGHYPDRLWQST